MCIGHIINPLAFVIGPKLWSKRVAVRLAPRQHFRRTSKLLEMVASETERRIQKDHYRRWNLVCAIFISPLALKMDMGAVWTDYLALILTSRKNLTSPTIVESRQSWPTTISRLIRAQNRQDARMRKDSKKGWWMISWFSFLTSMPSLTTAATVNL